MIHHNLLFLSLIVGEFSNVGFPAIIVHFLMHTMHYTVFSILADLIMSKNSGPNSKMIKSTLLACQSFISLFWSLCQTLTVAHEY